MRIFLFLCSALCLLLAAHRFSIAEPSGQYKGALFFLLIGIQLLITAALISDHRESRTPKSPMATEKEDREEAEPSVDKTSVEQEKKS
ncbi:hypothetical protein [Candidatus Nitrospira nitrificans]|uniref:Uncharacterized protein n=1 Tax=Candidatus Nitrospira nitrificans TaxID=1742973 RepID=A0A0S4LTW5_9BACT|nr:hypothetical protein [Candidatus Nitrospira nitrificans]CUS39976.1 exported hypothetical protein [Candidatus Nitrospira nitrificans]